MTESTVLTERRDRVLVITLNRPGQRNAMNGELVTDLVAAVATLDGDDDLRAGVLTGAGSGFCAGLDLKAGADERVSAIVPLLREGAVKPLVAAVEGFALAGGLELALTCDLIVAGADARLGLPEVKVGMFAGGGGVFRLAAHLGPAKAMMLALTGDPITADEAERHGLVAKVTQAGGALDAAVALAAQVAANAPLAVAAVKRLVRASPGTSEAELWDLMGTLYPMVFESNDAREGPTAFAEKRPPQWTGT